MTDLRDKMKDITVPLLLILADGGYQQSYKAMVEPVPDKKIVVVPHTRHFVMLDDPDKFSAALETFLKDHDE
jgi:pimeloyl-ACP methyl ester carboxylesterase